MSARRQPTEEPDIPEDEELEMDDDDEDMEGMDPFDALGSFLATEEGETIATALVSLKDATEKIAESLALQNKIMVKILSAISSQKCGCGCAPPTPVQEA
jgi:hypothetical protein